MKVMIVGGGGREHALGWKISKSKEVSSIIFVPGNAGMAELGECVKADSSDLEGMLKIAKDRAVDFVVVGPEAPLAAGIVDLFSENGLRVFGPRRDAARIESSKSFAKTLMEKYGIPTPKARTFTSFDEAEAYVRKLTPPVVVKADGLAAGKGVTVAFDIETAIEALSFCIIEKGFGDSGSRVMVEEYVEGKEISILSLTDGKALAHMSPSQDHKRAFDGDEGPNTGGMGAYSPVPFLDSETEAFIHSSVMEATVRALEAEGSTYRGVLYGGLMLTEESPKVLEFNVRFGDPETQAILPRLESDLLDGMLATLEGTIANYDMRWSSDYCICVVIASGGYPGSYSTGIPIKGIKAASADPKVEIFHAGTAIEDGKLVTAGGRVLNVVALGGDIEEARGLAYESVRMISFEGMHYRSDIGKDAFALDSEAKM
ncbi:MAG: phosphoribosylamine--glycine ligase [Actinomycetota bacterium]|nr:phosphoribosylamine--glycine ligase [Actinomycetota bacterium]